MSSTDVAEVEARLEAFGERAGDDASEEAAASPDGVAGWRRADRSGEGRQRELVVLSITGHLFSRRAERSDTTKHGGQPREVRRQQHRKLLAGAQAEVGRVGPHGRGLADTRGGKLVGGGIDAPGDERPQIVQPGRERLDLVGRARVDESVDARGLGGQVLHVSPGGIPVADDRRP